jgi:hypothetical protein
LALLTACAGREPPPEPDAPVFQPATSPVRAAATVASRGRDVVSAGEVRASPAVWSSADNTPARSGSLIRDVRPWQFGYINGQAIHTERFIIHTTERSPQIATRLPGFMEIAADHYRRALMPDGGQLPQPGGQMVSYVMNNRRQWLEIAGEVLGPERAASLHQIPRGGLTFKGQALLFDIGPSDTLSIAAHEGWHQYTQTTFRQLPPIWLEEGLACFMEGHRWLGGAEGSPTFAGWANPGRYDNLRRAAAENRLLSLRELLTTSPVEIIGLSTDADAAVRWYAQVWALAHFLNEGEDGRYRPGLQALLRDCLEGRMEMGASQRLSAVAQGRMGASGGAPRAFSLGPEAQLRLFAAYFNDDLDEAGAQYLGFVRRAISVGGRDLVLKGQSPVTPAGTEGQR